MSSASAGRLPTVPAEPGTSGAALQSGASRPSNLLCPGGDQLSRHRCARRGNSCLVLDRVARGVRQAAGAAIINSQGSFLVETDKALFEGLLRDGPCGHCSLFRGGRGAYPTYTKRRNRDENPQALLGRIRDGIPGFLIRILGLSGTRQATACYSMPITFAIQRVPASSMTGKSLWTSTTSPRSSTGSLLMVFKALRRRPESASEPSRASREASGVCCRECAGAVGATSIASSP